MAAFVLGHMEAIWFVPLLVLNAAYLVISYAIGIFASAWDKARHQKVYDWFHRQFMPMMNPPSVDVFLPVCREDESIVLNAWDATKRLRWCGDLTVYVLDDGDSDFLKEEALKRGFQYIRREVKSMKKAGNILNAFSQTKGDLILILDADFAPRADFLEEAVPYLVYDPRCAIVQTPQYFEVAPWMSWVERGSGYVQELFYRLIQVSRNSFKGSICVGSCGLYKRSAMERIGGPVQIEHSEDVWTGFTLSNAGYYLEYLPLNLAKGRCPDSLRNYFNQQYRWCSGSMSLCFTKYFWKSNLTFGQKFCYFSGMLYYIATAFSMFTLPLPGIFMILWLPEFIKWYNVFFYLPSFLFGTIIVVLWSHYGAGWNYLLLRNISYYAHFLAIVDKMRGKVQGWVATGQKVKTNSKFTLAKRICLIWSSLIATINFTMVGFRINEGMDPTDFIPVVLFSIFHLTVAQMSFLRPEGVKEDLTPEPNQVHFPDESRTFQDQGVSA
jgi:cellulose synthase/poly-beta-1,6-N-acetylglucosamine synthase-like glycosyltransferase